MLIAMAATQILGPYIEFKDVCKAFGDRVILKDVSFDVLPGEMVCILGRSGVGKSVALHTIMGFLKPDSGRVMVAGQDVTDYGEIQLEGIRKKVTMVFQKSRFTRSSMACSKWLESRRCASCCPPTCRRG